MQSISEMELLQLARLAAGAERKPISSIEDLVRASFLPNGFQIRSDGSSLFADGDRLLDSVRGARGYFLPIPDTPLNGLTADELSQYSELADFYERHWPYMDPVTICVKRMNVDDDGRNRIAIQAWMLPFDKEKYGGFASMLGPPTEQLVACRADDIVWAQASVRGGPFLPHVPLHTMFFGLKDQMPVVDRSLGPVLRWLRIIRTAPAYLGAWPRPGLLDRLPWGQPTVDARGYSQFPFGLWRREMPGGTAVVSFDRSILEKMPPIEIRQTPGDAAQVRLYVGDLSSSNVGLWINTKTPGGPQLETQGFCTR